MNTQYWDTDRADLEKHIGCPAQMCYAKKMTFDDGPASGLHLVEVQNGSGLFCHILSDRGMGIGHATIKGVPACWISPNEEIAPQFYNPEGISWLQTFGGGMLTCCGLTNVGSATHVDGVNVGLHGRISHIPARNVTIQSRWNEGKYKTTVEGDMVCCTVMGLTLILHRCYSFTMGENTIHLHDHITNLGDKREPFFLLYHINIGYPFLSKTTKIRIGDRTGNIGCQDESYAGEASRWNVLSDPVKGYHERVFYHLLRKKKGIADVSLTNEIGDTALGLHISFPLEELNHLVEWKMLGQRTYILGLEPGNTFASGRQYSFDHDDVEYLEPGESKETHVDLAFSVETL